MRKLAAQSLLHGNTAVRHSQAGVVLIFALIMLIVISMVALISLKNSVSGEQVSNNLRTNAVATQAAEAALRYCEDQVVSAAAGAVINELALDPDTLPTLWTDRANWTTSFAMVVPSSFMDSAVVGARAQRTLPMCMIEEYPLRKTDINSPQNAHLISAIGYSPDYSKNAAGVVVAGGEVWMQLLLRH